MNGRKRKIQIKFYVTEEERALIEQKMKLVPTRNMAAYLRKIAIDGYIIQTDHSDIKGMTAEIQKIGVNINQIAKRVNATGSVYQEDIEEIKGVLAEIWRLQRLSLLKEAYRRAKDKDAYRAKQESSLILHEAAVKTLKAAGVTKLPNLAAMQEEYGKLQAQKEALYADYGKLKNRSRNTTLSNRTWSAAAFPCSFQTWSAGA